MWALSGAIMSNKDKHSIWGTNETLFLSKYKKQSIYWHNVLTLLNVSDIFITNRENDYSFLFRWLGNNISEFSCANSVRYSEYKWPQWNNDIDSFLQCRSQPLTLIRSGFSCQYYKTYVMIIAIVNPFYWFRNNVCIIWKQAIFAYCWNCIWQNFVCI